MHRRIGGPVPNRAFDKDRLERMDEVLNAYAAWGETTGLVWLVAHDGDEHSGCAGALEKGGAPVTRDSIFRISSMSKPIAAVTALSLVEDCTLRLSDPIDELVPELANRRVLVDPHGSLDDTVPANRSITVEDLLTFRMGIGMDFGFFGRQPVLKKGGELGLGDGPPRPQQPPATDEWIRRLGTLPLERQPGERWLYHVSADVLGVVIERAGGKPFGDVVRERVLEPLGMHDTAFSVPPEKRDRFGATYFTNPQSNEEEVFDAPDGEWSAPPSFPSAGGGMVSTLDDYARFAAMLRNGGTLDGTRILARPTFEAMTTNQLTPEQLAESAPAPNGASGWGLGVGVLLKRQGTGPAPGSYGWTGGLGSVWTNDPVYDVTTILMSTNMLGSPVDPPLFSDFVTSAYAAIAD
jgi:CubicO group peptidase (beta-lactamase class C family)